MAKREVGRLITWTTTMVSSRSLCKCGRGRGGSTRVEMRGGDENPGAGWSLSLHSALAIDIGWVEAFVVARQPGFFYSRGRTNSQGAFKAQGVFKAGSEGRI
jgi:hypothetical protein